MGASGSQRFSRHTPSNFSSMSILPYDVERGGRGCVLPKAGQVSLAQVSVELILIFLGITFLSFCLTYLAPSDPAEIQLNKTGVAPTEELLEKTREEMGLNRPFPVQYAGFL